MSNRLLLVVQMRKGFGISAFIRDFKKFTSKRIYENLCADLDERRRAWMKWIFESHGKENRNNKNFQVWQQKSKPEKLLTNEVLLRKINKIHFEPVRDGIVRNVEDYKYSSAVDYKGGKGLIPIVKC